MLALASITEAGNASHRFTVGCVNWSAISIAEFTEFTQAIELCTLNLQGIMNTK